MNQFSIHDNNVYSYAVDCERGEVVLHTERREGDGLAFTDVVFSGVVAHHLENVQRGNILFGVDELEAEQLIQEWRELFDRLKPFGWPAIEYGPIEELCAILRQRGIRCFEISASYGLMGVVLGGRMRLEQRARRAAVNRDA
jgi:hypothetical protein